MGDSASNIKELSWETSQARTETCSELLPSGEKLASCVVSFLMPLSYKRASPIAQASITASVEGALAVMVF